MKELLDELRFKRSSRTWITILVMCTVIVPGLFYLFVVLLGISGFMFSGLLLVPFVPLYVLGAPIATGIAVIFAVRLVKYRKNISTNTRIKGWLAVASLACFAGYFGWLLANGLFEWLIFALFPMN